MTPLPSCHCRPSVAADEGGSLRLRAFDPPHPDPLPAGRGKSEANRGARRRRAVRTFVSILLLAAASACASPQESAPAEAAPPVRVRAIQVRRGAIARHSRRRRDRGAERGAPRVPGRGPRHRAGPAARRHVAPARSSRASCRSRTRRRCTASPCSASRRAARRASADRAALRARPEAAATSPCALPFAAVVADRLHNPGEQVAADDVLLELFDPRSLYVVAQVPVGAPATSRRLPVEVRVGGAHRRRAGRRAADAVTPERADRAGACRADRAVAAAAAARGGAVPDPWRAHHERAARSAPALVSSTVESARHGHGRRRRPNAPRAVTLGLRTADEVEVIDGLAEARSC